MIIVCQNCKGTFSTNTCNVVPAENNFIDKKTILICPYCSHGNYDDSISGEVEIINELNKLETNLDIVWKDEHGNMSDAGNALAEEIKEIKTVVNKLRNLERNKQIAKQCLEFKGCYCDNPDCKNKSCPLNKNG